MADPAIDAVRIPGGRFGGNGDEGKGGEHGGFAYHGGHDRGTGRPWR